jgi:hypothetical protein
MRTRRRIIAALLAAWYGLVIGTSGLFHSHVGHVSPGHTHAAAGCCSHDATHPTSSHPDPAPHRSDSPSSSDDQTCSVCQFLAQKLIPAASSVEVVSTELVERTVRAEAVRLPSELPRVIHSRAPPAVV